MKFFGTCQEPTQMNYDFFALKIALFQGNLVHQSSFQNPFLDFSESIGVSSFDIEPGAYVNTFIIIYFLNSFKC